ncbi:MAG: curli-like amyloid fiber formation chaperone CsgH [Pseudomonadota bacterium]
MPNFGASAIAALLAALNTTASKGVDDQTAAAPANEGAEEKSAWIAHSVDGRLHTFTPMAILNQGDSGEYKLRVFRDGAGGRTDNTQGGRLPVVDDSGDPATLARTTISIDEGDDWTIELTVSFDDGRTAFSRLTSAAAEPAEK